MDREDFSIVFFPCLHREFVYRTVEQFNASVSGRCQDLVLVNLGPGEIVEGILSGESAKFHSDAISHEQKKRGPVSSHCSIE